MIASLLALTLAAAPSPLAVVKNGNAEIQKVLDAPGATTEKLAARADEFVDFVELAKRALGKEWAKLSQKQQDDFAQTMKGLLRASYAQKAIGNGKSKATTEYGAEQVSGDEATVATTIALDTNKISVDYKLYRAGAKGAWKIYDVVTDTVSLVATYQDQFRSVLAKKGFDGLLTTLKAKRDQLERKGATPTAGAK